MNLSSAFVVCFLIVFFFFLGIDHWLLRKNDLKKSYYWVINALTLVLAVSLLFGFKPVMPTYPIATYVSQWVIQQLGDTINESTSD